MNRLALTTLAFGCLAVTSSVAQTWTAVQGTPNIAANNPLLLTDGAVMIQDGDNSDWYKLTPDAKGSYLTGKWSKLASTTGWGPLYYASQVMPDGRVFAMGGEYNFGNAIWSNQGGVYDPVKNTWTMLTAPSGWTQIGDMSSVTLANGQIFMANPLSSQCAIFDPTTNKFTAPYGANKAEGNDEEGLTMLPNGNIYTVDVGIADGAELFNTGTQLWSRLPNTPYDVVDRANFEIGPAVLQYNGLVIQFGGNGNNIVFNPATNKWSTAPSFPKVTSGQLDCADAPAVLLPNGNVLVEAGPGYALQGCYFFIWNGSTLTQVVGPPDASQNVDFAGNFLLLPSGQVLFSDQSPNLMIYQPTGTPDATWAPTITTVPAILKAGASYTISGTQFNGLSGGSAYGDDQQNQTNYPIIRLTMKSSGNVYYCKEYNPSTMAICTGKQIVSTHFTVPATTELGQGVVQVITNGIASKPVAITVYPPIGAGSVSLFQGTNGHGTVASVDTIDGTYYAGNSIRLAEGQCVAVEADFQLPVKKLLSVSVRASASAKAGATEQVYVYDWIAKSWVILQSVAFGSGQTSISGSNSTNASRFVSSTGLVKTIVRGVLPTHVSPSPYTLKVDLLALQFS